MNFVGGALRQTAHHNQLVQLYWIARYDYQDYWAFRPHIHDFSQIIYIMEGRGTFSLQDEDFVIGPGTVLLMMPGTPHALKPPTESPVRSIDAKFAVFHGDFWERLHSIATPIQDKDDRILHILQNVHQEAIENKTGHYELSNALMTQALVNLLRASEDSIPNDVPEPIPFFRDELVHKARTLIAQRFSGGLTLNDISSAIGTSSQNLERHFRKTMGMTVHEYVLRYRIYRAKEELRYARMPIKEIAYHVGFKSVHHFSRVFSRLEHMPPAAWRDSQSGVGRRGITVTPGFVAVDVTVNERTDEAIPL